VSTTSVIRTGQVSLTAKDLDAVRDDVRDLLTALGGSIDKDEASSDPKGRLQHAQMVLRVPVGRFDAALSALKKLGRLQSSDESSKDVTTEVIDVDERVQTLQNSLDDLQRFQRAAKDVGDLLRFEEQITARQSELQSLTAQQSYLAGQSALSTITLELSTPDTYVPPPDALEDAGFLAGLQAGWAGLRTAVVVALTVLGAVLPFAATVLLVGVPAWLLLRTALRRRRTAAPTASAEG
jgi:hypothetical protein